MFWCQTFGCLLKSTTVSLPPEIVTALKLLRARRSLAATVGALLTGGGLTLAAYTVIQAALLTPLPFFRPDRLVRVWDAGQPSSNLRLLDAPAMQTLADTPGLFSSMAAFVPLQQQIALPSGKTADVAGALVSGRVFDLLGVRALAGRLLTPDDDREASSSKPVVISQRLVESGLATGRVDDVIRIDGEAYRVVGVVADDFWFPDKQTRYWTPLLVSARDAGASTIAYGVVARLARDMTAERAQALASVRVMSGDARRRVRVQNYGATLLETIRPALTILEAAAALLLVLVLLNLAWLFASRARRLAGTFSTLRALGASERSVTSTYVLAGSLVGAIAAPGVVLVASSLLQLADAFESGTISRVADLTLTPRVLAEGLCGTVFAAALCAFPGALLAGRRSLSRVAPPSRVSWKWHGMSLQVAMVFAVGVMALSLALVLRATAVANVGLARTDFSIVRLEDRRVAATDAFGQVAKLNGLIASLSREGISVAAANILPLTTTDARTVLGAPGLERRQWRTPVRIRVVTSSYFSVTGTRPLRGRVLDGSDVGLNRAVINDEFARSLLPDGQVIGRRVPEWSPYVEWASRLTFVGVVPAVKQFDFDEPRVPEIYVLYDDYVRLRGSQAGNVLQRMFLVSSGDSGAIVRSVAAREWPELDVSEMPAMKTLVSGRLGARRLVGLGSGLFAAIGVVLAALGLYGMVSSEISRRARENGIRLALGATWRTLAFHTLAPLLVTYGAGISTGAILLISMRGLLRAAVVPPPGIAYPSLVVVAALVAAVLAVSGALACAAPLARLRRIDPGQILRAE